MFLLIKIQSFRKVPGFGDAYEYIGKIMMARSWREKYADLKGPGMTNALKKLLCSVCHVPSMPVLRN